MRPAVVMFLVVLLLSTTVLFLPTASLVLTAVVLLTAAVASAVRECAALATQLPGPAADWAVPLGQKVPIVHRTLTNFCAENSVNGGVACDTCGASRFGTLGRRGTRLGQP
jgi:hypothetical protein